MLGNCCTYFRAVYQNKRQYLSRLYEYGMVVFTVFNTSLQAFPVKLPVYAYIYEATEMIQSNDSTYIKQTDVHMYTSCCGNGVYMSLYMYLYTHSAYH